MALSLPAVNAAHNPTVNLLSHPVLLDPTSPAATPLHSAAGAYIPLNIGSNLCLYNTEHRALSPKQENPSGEAAADVYLLMVLAELQGLEEI